MDRRLQFQPPDVSQSVRSSDGWSDKKENDSIRFISVREA